MTPIHVALVGCGSFARGLHLPNMHRDGRYRIRVAVDANLEAAKMVAEMEDAGCTDDLDQALADPDVQAVFIVTPHHLHADFSVRAARAGKHIFCEKPMGLTEEECLAVAGAVRESGVKYTAGYNRSIAPFTMQARELLAGLNAPIMINHRMADWFPYSRGWLLEEKLSGGRVIGEAGHALDMICRLVGMDPVRVYAEGGNLVGQGDPGMPDSAIITLGFPDGSCGVMFLSSVANNGFPKEEVQITCANHTLVIYNFERMELFNPDGKQEFVLPAMNKGQAELVSAFADAILEDKPAPNGIEAALRTSRCTFGALRSIRTHQVEQL
jgi:predicted dehydrogenase